MQLVAGWITRRYRTGVDFTPLEVYLRTVRVPVQRLELENDSLNMDFTVGSTEPATWNVYFAVYNVVVPLWSVPLPAIALPVAFPFPSLVGIGVLTTLTTPGGGIICSDWKTVDTGP